MENKKINLTSIQTKSLINIVVIVVGVIVIGGIIYSLGVGYGIFESAAPAKKVTVNISKVTSGAISTADLNGDKQVLAGDSGQVFLDFDAKPSLGVIISKLVFSIDSASSNALLVKIKNWKLYQIISDSVTGDRTLKLIGETPRSQNGVVTISNLNFSVGANTVSSFLLKGDIGRDILSGQIQLRVDSATAVALKTTIGISNNVVGPKITVIGRDEIPAIAVSTPVAKSQWSVGQTMPISWNTKNYPADTPLSILLMRKADVGGVVLDEIVQAIVVNTDNDGSENWIIPASGLTTGDNYFIQISCGWGYDFQNGCNSGQSGVFGIIK